MSVAEAEVPVTGTCSKCGETKSLVEFGSAARYAEGSVDSWCQTCFDTHREGRRQERLDDPVPRPAVLARRRKYSYYWDPTMDLEEVQRRPTQTRMSPLALERFMADLKARPPLRCRECLTHFDSGRALVAHVMTVCFA